MSRTGAEIEAAVMDIVREHFELGPERKLSLNTNIFDDLGADSLDMAEIGMQAEDHFDVNAREEDEKPRTIGDLVAMVQAALPVESAQRD